MMRFILSALKSGYDIQNIVVISSDNNLFINALALIINDKQSKSTLIVIGVLLDY